MKKTICLLVMFLQALWLTASATEDEPVVYSDVEISGILPNNGTEITSDKDREIIISFKGSVVIDKEKSYFTITDDGSRISFESIISINDKQSLWGFFIARDIINKSTGEIKAIIYANDQEGRPVKGNKDGYTELTYKCYLGVPDFVLSPSDGYVDALESFTFSYMEGIAVNPDNERNIVLYGSDKSTVIGTYTAEDVKEPEEEDDTKTLTIDLDNGITATGSYWLYVPDGFFLLGNDRIGNKYMWKEYNIEDVTHKYGVTLDPLNGSEVTGLSQIKITFDNWNYAIPYYRNNKSIVLTDAEGDTIAVGTTPKEDNRDKVNQCLITLDHPVTTPGDYILIIPDYAFILDQSTNYHSDEMSFHYRIIETEDPETDITATPVSGNGTSIGRVDLRFNGVSVVKTVADQLTATITDSEGTVITEGKVVNGPQYTVLNVFFENQITAQGTYYIHIPANTLKTDNKVYQHELTAEFVVGTTSGIQEMTQDEGNRKVKIYSLDGRLVGEGTPAGLHGNLKGIYIIGGKKVNIK